MVDYGNHKLQQPELTQMAHKLLGAAVLGPPCAGVFQLCSVPPVLVFRLCSVPPGLAYFTRTFHMLVVALGQARTEVEGELDTGLGQQKNTLSLVLPLNTLVALDEQFKSSSASVFPH